MSAPEQPPPFDPVLPTPAAGGCYELDPETGELTPEDPEESPE